MGVFYYIRSVALLEDLPEAEGGHHTIEDFIATVEAGYTQVSSSTKCYLALDIVLILL